MVIQLSAQFEVQ